MDLIVEQLINLNKKDWLDVAGIAVPILLTMVIIVQNKIYARKSEQLQKQIHNRDRINQYHNDILAIYRVYYEFCEFVYNSGFGYYVRIGNVNMAQASINDLLKIKKLFMCNLDLAKLIFGRANDNLFKIIEERFKLGIEILDKYYKYITEGRLLEVSENAWNNFIGSNPELLMYRYNYFFIQQDDKRRDYFLQLCRSEEIDEIEELLKDYVSKHEYEKYDVYFEKFFSLEELT